MQNIRLEGPLETQHNPFISQMEEQTHVIRMRGLYICWHGKIKARYLWSETSKLKDTKYSISPFFSKGSNHKNAIILSQCVLNSWKDAPSKIERSATRKQERDVEYGAGAGLSIMKHFTLSFMYFVMFVLYAALYCFCNRYIHECMYIYVCVCVHMYVCIKFKAEGCLGDSVS